MAVGIACQALLEGQTLSEQSGAIGVSTISVGDPQPSWHEHVFVIEWHSPWPLQLSMAFKHSPLYMLADASAAEKRSANVATPAAKSRPEHEKNIFKERKGNKSRTNGAKGKLQRDAEELDMKCVPINK